MNSTLSMKAIMPLTVNFGAPENMKTRALPKKLCSAEKLSSSPTKRGLATTDERERVHLNPFRCASVAVSGLHPAAWMRRVKWEVIHTRDLYRYPCIDTDYALVESYTTMPATWLQAWYGSPVDRADAVSAYLTSWDQAMERGGKVMRCPALRLVESEGNLLTEQALRSTVTLVALRRFLDSLLLSPNSLAEARQQCRRLVARTSPDHNDALIRSSEPRVKHFIYQRFSKVKCVFDLLDHPELGPRLYEVPAGDFGTHWWNRINTTFSPAWFDQGLELCVLGFQIGAWALGCAVGCALWLRAQGTGGPGVRSGSAPA